MMNFLAVILQLPDDLSEAEVTTGVENASHQSQCWRIRGFNYARAR